MKYRVFFISGMRWWLVGVVNHGGADHLILTCLREYARQFTKRERAEEYCARLRRLGYRARIETIREGGKST